MEDSAAGDRSPTSIALVRARPPGADELTPMRGARCGRRASPPRAARAPRSPSCSIATTSRCVVGTIDGVVVGFGVGRVETLRDGARPGVVDELFVEPEARSVGVGEAVVGAAARVLRRRTAASVPTRSRCPETGATKNFFEQQGFVARSSSCTAHLTPDRVPDPLTPSEGSAMTATDLTAADVAWDLETLLPDPGDPGVDELLDEADAVDRARPPFRGRHRDCSTDEIVELVGARGACSELIGRAGNYAGLRLLDRHVRSRRAAR